MGHLLILFFLIYVIYYLWHNGIPRSKFLRIRMLSLFIFCFDLLWVLLDDMRRNPIIPLIHLFMISLSSLLVYIAYYRGQRSGEVVKDDMNQLLKYGSLTVGIILMTVSIAILIFMF